MVLAVLLFFIRQGAAVFGFLSGVFAEYAVVIFFRVSFYCISVFFAFVARVHQPPYLLSPSRVFASGLRCGGGANEVWLLTGRFSPNTKSTKTITKITKKT